MPKGSCLCGAVAFEITGDMRAVTCCHCQQCRKASGHHWAATQVPDDQLTLIKDEGLAWYRSSDRAQRGFCKSCGSSLFWKRDGTNTTSIGAGSIDAPSTLNINRHIFVADKGDYYDISDDLPQFDAF